MLTKAYIQEVLSPHSVKVRIPLYHKIEGVGGSTRNDELPVGCVCTLPNFVTDINPGDIVILGFEEDNISKPVVLGHLSTNNPPRSLTDITCNKLVAKGDVVLDEHTTIGGVEPENIKCLERLSANIGDTFEIIDKEIKLLHTTAKELEEGIVDNANSIVKIKDTDLTDIRDLISRLSTRITTLEQNYTNLSNQLNDYLLRQTPILIKPAYGSESERPENPVEGQVYFTLMDGEK